MGQDERRKSHLAKLALKFGTVATAAAALLAEGTASASESDVLKGILDHKDVVPALSADAEAQAALTLPPLVLKPSHVQPRWLLAGHRSHSSHSSHRSHSSGSAHSSHYSSSTLTRPRSSSSTWSTSPGPSAESTGRPSTLADTPRTAPARRVAPTPAPKVKAAADKRPLDPTVRYELIRVQEFQGLQKAYIMDHSVERASLIKLGERIGDCMLVEILPGNNSVRLKPSTGPAFTVTRAQPAK
jgi:hypothetical protein